MNESFKLASTFNKYLIRELTKHNSRGGPATLHRQCPKGQKPPQEDLFQRSLNPIFESSEPKKNAGRNRLGCSDRPKRRPLKLPCFLGFHEMPIPSRKQRKLWRRRKGYLKRIRTRKMKGSGTFFSSFYLFQLVVFTKTNTQSTTTSPSSFSS